MIRPRLGVAAYNCLDGTSAPNRNDAANSQNNQQKVSASAAETAPSENLKILLVDDAPDNVLLVKAYLSHTSYDVDVAENGAIAVEMFKRKTYDLVLMDIQMPVMDGHTATRQMREWEREQGCRAGVILALTAHSLEADRQKSLAAGCNAHLTKPIKMDVLLDAIERYSRHGG